MRFGTVALLVASALAIGGCSSFRIRSDYDRKADFVRLHTYAWLPLTEAEPADQRVLDRFIDTRIRTAVGTQLDGKGYRPAGAAGPDFFLNYRLATQATEDVRGNPHGYFRGAGWWGWPGLESLYSESYDEGTLYLAVLDGQTKRMIWLGAASARILPHISLDRRVKRVDAAVHRILGEFPPG